MYLVDFEIQQLIEEGVITGDDLSAIKVNIQPASLDVRVGTRLLVEVKPNLFLALAKKLFPSLPITVHQIYSGREWKEVDLSQYSKDNPYWLYPNQFVLAETIELFGLYPNLVADFKLRSSAAREGYENLLAGWCDPGWGYGGSCSRRRLSRLTLELKNARQYKPIPLYPGLRIGQMIFSWLTHTPRFPYNLKGRYNGDETVTPSKGID
jgi:dCTP deaminase